MHEGHAAAGIFHLQTTKEITMDFLHAKRGTYRTKTTVVPMRLTPTELATLDEIAKTGLYDSRSSAIRAALGMLFDKHHVDGVTESKIESERRIHAPRRAAVKVPGPASVVPSNGKPTAVTGNTRKPANKAKKVGAKVK